MRKFISFQENNEQSEATGTNRWMVSYADFMTLLFVLFLVLYARLPKHLDMGVPTNQRVMVPLIPGIHPRHIPVPIEPKVLIATPIIDKQQVLLKELARTFTDLLQAGDITLVTREQGVLLEIKDSALFASGTAQPAVQADAILEKVSNVLSKNDNQVVVEGHTDSVPIQTAQFPSNWELSSARAASVVRALQERGIDPERMSASGFAETRPKTSNDTAQGRSENRRVSLLVLSK